MVPGAGPSFPAGFLFLALEDLFLLMEQVNTKSQAPGRINDENVNHTPTRKTGVSHTLDLRHTFLYLTPLSSSASNARTRRTTWDEDVRW